VKETGFINIFSSLVCIFLFLTKPTCHCFSFCIQAEGAANNNYLVQYALAQVSSVFTVIFLLQLLLGDLYILFNEPTGHL